ncbi:uncharacterized protein LOC123665196 [Melitaea cinxia]|uniref:uncharacterized protein LOC123665196 n=1 Tax=Melitaea cinxia TaxID=113334 RepID=UPI001E271070|nr:uncharacterized protein LOC123665196 [Melitaea cinxia]
MLATRKQRPEESIDTYLQALKLLSKDCDFAAVDAETNKNDNIRDAFIAGISSHKIRQRLLENLTLTLDQAYNQALSLETAEINSQSFNTVSLNAVAAKEPTLISPKTQTVHNETCSSVNNPRRRKCFFCGGQIHPRKNCPAFEKTCQTWQTLKIGNHKYDNVNLLIVKNLCADIIIGHDILEEHSSLEFSFGGPKHPLQVYNVTEASEHPFQVCNVAEASVPAVSLFANVPPNCKPIAIKSRRHSKEYRNFYMFEVLPLVELQLITLKVTVK